MKQLHRTTLILAMVLTLAMTVTAHDQTPRKPKAATSARRKEFTRKKLRAAIARPGGSYIGETEKNLAIPRRKRLRSPRN